MIYLGVSKYCEQKNVLFVKVILYYCFMKRFMILFSISLLMLFVSSSPPAKGQGYGGYGYYAPVLGVPAYGVNTTVVGYNNVVQTNVYQAPAVDYFGGTVIQTGYQNVDQYTGYNYDYLIQDVTPKQNSSNGGRYVTEDYYRPIDYSKYFE